MYLRTNRESPDQFYWSGDFFLSYGKQSPGLQNLHSKEDTMATREQSFCKITLFLIKDWDSFQLAMRGCLHGGSKSATHNTAEQR